MKKIIFFTFFLALFLQFKKQDEIKQEIARGYYLTEEDYINGKLQTDKNITNWGWDNVSIDGKERSIRKLGWYAIKYDYQDFIAFHNLWAVVVDIKSKIQILGIYPHVQGEDGKRYWKFSKIQIRKKDVNNGEWSGSSDLEEYFEDYPGLWEEYKKTKPLRTTPIKDTRIRLEYIQKYNAYFTEKK